MRDPNARISRVHQSWRVRVFGYPPKFFGDYNYGDNPLASLEAARKWRDEVWDGKNPGQKLSKEDRVIIARSTEPAYVVASLYDITIDYVYKLRRKLK
jgi:hypothetical protein